jgi:hypothetical protein
MQVFSTGLGQMRALSSIAAIALALSTTTTASDAASVLQVRAGTGTPATVDAGNDYPFLDEPMAITLDGVLETTGAGTLTFEYVGSEAAWVNAFLVEGKDCFASGRSEVGATCSTATSGGVVDFQFRTSPGDDPGAAVWSNRAPPGSVQRYSIGLIQEAPNTFLILWDAGGHEDDDYDDLGVRVVFEPEVRRRRDRLRVMLAGVVGAAGFVRRRTREA